MYKPKEEGMLSPVEETFCRLAKKLYRQHKSFLEGMMLEVDKYSPNVTESESLAFELYWLKSGRKDLPHVFDFKNWLDRARTTQLVHEGNCRYGMCAEGDGYIGIVRLDNGEKETYRGSDVIRMGKYCPCKIGERSYISLLNSHFNLAKGQKCMN